MLMSAVHIILLRASTNSTACEQKAQKCTDESSTLYGEGGYSVDGLAARFSCTCILLCSVFIVPVYLSAIFQK